MSSITYAKGCLPRTTLADGLTFDRVGIEAPLKIKPREEWEPRSLRHHVWNIHNQGSQSSCCPTAYCGLLETVREMQGLERIELSQAYPYHYANGGRDQGSSLDGVFKVIHERGVTTADVIDPKDWRKQSWPSNADEEAAKLRIVEAWDCVNVNACGTAIQDSNPVVLGVRWGGGGHAIYIIGMRPKGNSWEFEIANSWGRQWEDGGFGFLPEVQVAAGIKTFGAWVPRFQRVQDSDPMPARPK